MAGVVNTIRTPLGAVLMLIVTLILAGLTVAASISGELTAAAVKKMQAYPGFSAISSRIGCYSSHYSHDQLSWKVSP